MFVRALRGLAAATLLVATASGVAQAQASSPSRFGVKAGVALPMGDFGDIAGLGIHVGGHFAMPLSGDWSLRFDADYGRYGGEGTVDNVTLFGGVANLVYNMQTTSALDPYFFGGLGYYNGKTEISGGGSSDGSDLAFNLGVGYDFKMGNSNLFTELRFLSIQSDGSSTNTLPIVIGMRF